MVSVFLFFFFLASAKGSSENCMEDVLYLWALEEEKKCVAYFRNPFLSINCTALPAGGDGYHQCFGSHGAR